MGIIINLTHEVDWRTDGMESTKDNMILSMMKGFAIKPLLALGTIWQ